jgi:polysaccharide deacetylase 2 family uncharacterized protein YibQ
MTADDLSAPLGQQQTKRRRKIPIDASQVIAAALALFFAVFVLWAIFADDPLGGEPMVAVPIDPHAATTAKKPEAGMAIDAANNAQGADRYDGPANRPVIAAPPPAQAASGAPAAPPNAKTVTIIDGKTGERQEMVVPGSGNAPAAADSAAAEPKFVQMTPHGAIPKIAADGMRPAEAFARPVSPLPGKPDAPRVALIVGGLGVSASVTAEAIAKLPGAVTLAFMPYGSGVERAVARARGEGHEVLLQVPMEPSGYPDNDSGPQTLLTSLTPEQNLDRLHWLMSRFQGYVGIAGAMGARFTASEPSFVPILRDTAARGLIFVDDGANPRSVAGRIAGANSLPFAKADMVLDSVPTPGEIEHALGRLEMAARERGVAVGICSALPVSIEQVGKWAKAAESRGVLLVPITAVALKAKQS